MGIMKRKQTMRIGVGKAAKGAAKRRKPNREDGGSIWTDMKRQEEIGRLPQTRNRPFRMG